MSFNNFFGNDPFFNSVFENDPFFNPKLRKRNYSQRYNGNQIAYNTSDRNNNQSLIAGDSHPFNDPFFNHMLMMQNNMSQSIAQQFHGLNNDSMFFGAGANAGSIGGDLQISVKSDHYKLVLPIRNLHKTSLDFHVDPDSRVVNISGSISQHRSQNGFTSVSEESFSKSATLPLISENTIINDQDCIISYDGELLVIKIPVIQKNPEPEIQYIEGTIEEL